MNFTTEAQRHGEERRSRKELEKRDKQRAVNINHQDLSSPCLRVSVVSYFFFTELFLN